MTSHHVVVASAGASSGFSTVALWQWLTSPSAASAAAFVGSAASTVLGWWLARRQEIARARLAELAEAREDARRQDFLDAVNAALIRRAVASEIVTDAEERAP